MGSPKDGWSGDHIGTFNSLSSIKRSSGPADGTRSYVVTGYLLPNASRPNLHVLTDALVTKLIIENGSVNGHESLHSGKSNSVKTKKEVVLSAGVFKTPQILELSGIGNPDVLSRAGIKCQVENLRVGENLHDHPVLGIGFELVDGEQSIDMLRDPAVAQEAMEEYTVYKTGPFSSGGSATCFASFSDLADAEEIKAVQNSILESKDPASGGYSMQAKELLTEGLANSDNASIQILLLPASLNMARGDSQTATLGGDPGQEGKQGVVLGAAVGSPLSVGSVHITSSNPHDQPAIDPAYLSHEADVEIISKGIELCLKMVAMSPLKEKIKRMYYPDESWDLIRDWGL